MFYFGHWDFSCLHRFVVLELSDGLSKLICTILFDMTPQAMSSRYGSTDLTSKEWAITALVCQGHTNAQIAAEIQTSEFVVKNQLRTIFDKTGCWNRTEVALWYLKIGVQKEKRFYDRREAKQEISVDRRNLSRRHLPKRSPRANEHHEINLDE